MSSRHPDINWAERKDKVYLTILLPDAKDPKIDIDPEGTFTFTATGGQDNNLYELELNLLDKVNAEESKINISVRNIFCVLEKVEKKWWTKLLRGNEKTPRYVKRDLDRWAEEDEEDGAGQPIERYGDYDLDLGDMEGMAAGGMGDIADMVGGTADSMGGGMNEFEDSDDEGKEEKAAEVGK
ncbi:hypothetical protein CASFOL_029566 [Castilleja foliolosa]|uniref:Co-chaperone protein p23 n=1 Tax=Castilleja foliolosa TaxID=1961234 RepID=A0ABD3C8X6_9LAMI